ncbi:MAG: helix-turn-helix transcriptional regulator, partial [Chloroflexi bacterium]|nr:helix-turn-helix transcriptional regulator [Chloroflexota bacterium]
MTREARGVAAEVRRQITDVRVLRALANPIRYRLFGHLMAVGTQTASECAAVVGATPSNCSYHHSHSIGDPAQVDRGTRSLPSRSSTCPRPGRAARERRLRLSK